MDDNEAIWKMNEFAKVLHRIERHLEDFKELIPILEKSGMPPVQQWNVILPLSQAMKITIRKEAERITEYEQLTMKEIMSRVRFRSCHEGLCLQNHCSECGLCSARLADGHACNPPDLPES